MCEKTEIRAYFDSNNRDDDGKPKPGYFVTRWVGSPQGWRLDSGGSAFILRREAVKDLARRQGHRVVFTNE